MSQQILVLNPNAKRELGREAQMGIITAARAVAEIIRTTLGPKSMLKMLIDSTGRAVLTNDGASVLREIDVQHPAAKSLIELSRTQDERVGDGTTSVVVIAGELMEAARPFLSDGMHPARIVAAFRRAADLALSRLYALAQPVASDDREQLVRLAVTSLGTKFAARFGRLVPELAVDAVSIVQTQNKERAADFKSLAKVEKVVGGDVSQSVVLNGVMLNKDILHASMRRKVSDAKILLLDCALEYKKAESETNVEMTSAAHWRRYLELEEQFIRQQCRAVVALKPDVLVVEKGVSDMAQHFLQQANVSVLRRVRKSDLQRLALACGARVGSQPEQMAIADVGSCGLFEVRKLGDDYWSFFEGCSKPQACSVLLRGASRDGLDELERNLVDAMSVVRNVMADPRMVPGGGATEMALAAALQKEASDVGEVELKPFLAAAKALEIIPKTLAANGGANVNAVLSKLRQLHREGEEKWGVDGNKGAVADMTQLGLLDPLMVKEQAIKTAFETAIMLLRIDDILSGVSKPTEGSPAPQMSDM